MLIVWGNRRTARKLGYVADFCPMCREPRAFKLSRIGSVSHVYYISFGSGKLVGHIIECCECGQALPADPMRYPTYQKAPSNDLEYLIQQTNPNLRKEYAARIATESQVKRSPGALPKEERAQLLIEPFTLVGPEVEERYTGGTRMDKQSGLGCLGSLVGLGIFLGIGFNLREPLQSQILLAGFSLFAIGILYTFVQLGLGPGRFLRTKIAPKIARALDPLKPTLEEITACIDRCKAARMKIGQKLKPAILWAEVRKRSEYPSERG